MSTKMLINATRGGQLRVAIVEGTILQEFQVEVTEDDQTRGNIYRGVVANIQPSLNAAFVDLGEERHGFLPAGDVLPCAYHSKPPKDVRRPNISQVLEKGKPVLVQVTKDGVGQKGPALSTNLALAGRYLVLTPFDGVRGISRKAQDDQARKKIRERLKKLELPEDHGVIVRTNGLDQNQQTLNRDLNALLRLWKKVKTEAGRGRGAKLVYSDQDLVMQALRDYLDASIGEVVVDNDEVFAKAEAFMKAFMPRSKTQLVRYEDRLPLFSRYRLETQIDRIYERTAPLPSGGGIVIDLTEALTAIDVNSGRATKTTNHDESIFKINCEAAKEVARQLRLRDIGGLVVVDFIDMRLRKHQNRLERVMRDAMKRDNARHSVGRISPNGLLEINRQRIKQSLRLRTHRSCPTCSGAGTVPTPEFAALRLLSRIEARAASGLVQAVTLALHPEIADTVQNSYRSHLAAIELDHGVEIEILAAPALSLNEERIEWVQREGGSAAAAPVKARRAVHAADLTPPEKAGGAPEDEEEEKSEPKSGRRRRRRRRRPRRGAEQADSAEAAGTEQQTAPQAEQASGDSAEQTEAETTAADSEESAAEPAPKGRVRRRRRRRRRRSESGQAQAEQVEAAEEQAEAVGGEPAPDPSSPAAAGESDAVGAVEAGAVEAGAVEAVEAAEEDRGEQQAGQEAEQQAGEKKRVSRSRSRRRRKSRGGEKSEQAEAVELPASEPPPSETAAEADAQETAGEGEGAVLEGEPTRKVHRRRRRRPRRRKEKQAEAAEPAPSQETPAEPVAAAAGEGSFDERQPESNASALHEMRPRDPFVEALNHEAESVDRPVSQRLRWQWWGGLQEAPAATGPGSAEAQAPPAETLSEAPELGDDRAEARLDPAAETAGELDAGSVAEAESEPGFEAADAAAVSMTEPDGAVEADGEEHVVADEAVAAEDGDEAAAEAVAAEDGDEAAAEEEAVEAAAGGGDDEDAADDEEDDGDDDDEEDEDSDGEDSDGDEDGEEDEDSDGEDSDGDEDGDDDGDDDEDSDDEEDGDDDEDSDDDEDEDGAAEEEDDDDAVAAVEEDVAAVHEAAAAEAIAGDSELAAQLGDDRLAAGGDGRDSAPEAGDGSAGVVVSTFVAEASPYGEGLELDPQTHGENLPEDSTPESV